MNNFRVIQAALLLSVISNGTAVCADWNQWRGPDRTGVVNSDDQWPDKLSGEHIKQLWTATLAEGYSSPISADGQVFTVATKDKEMEISKAFDLQSGKMNWENEWEGSLKVPFFAAKNGSWVRSTPIFHEGAVYVGGMRDVLVKLDAKTGDEIWRIDFTKREETEAPSFGQVCSPLIDEGSLYLQAGLAVAKIDTETGETIWRAMEDRRAMFGSAFASPIIATLAGKRQLIVQARLAMAGLDLETGEELWSIPVKAFRGMNILTPTIIDENRIFTASYGGGSFLIKISAKDDGTFSAVQEWNNEKAEGYMGSPVLFENHIYLHGRDQMFHCVDLTDGAILWSTDEEFGAYWSMIQQGNRILALDEKGELLLIEANPESFNLLDRKKVSPDDTTWAHLGIDGNKLLIRSLKGISVFEWQ